MNVREMSAHERRIHFLSLIDRHDLPHTEVMKLCGKSRRVIFAWKQGERPVPVAELRLLELELAVREGKLVA